MKEKWKKLKTIWRKFWIPSDAKQESTRFLTRADMKISCHCFILMCAVTVAICMIVSMAGSIYIAHQSNRNTEQLLKSMSLYFTTATEEEYDEIAKTLRHDLIFCNYSRNIDELIQHIPNISENCPTCRTPYPAQVSLICVNTGEHYSLEQLEIYGDPKIDSGGIRLSFGYDEISETSIHIAKYGSTKTGCADIYQGRHLVSIQRMKSTFCDECIRKIINTIEGQLLSEVVLFDAENKLFYPVENGSLIHISDYELTTNYEQEHYRIDIVGKK